MKLIVAKILRIERRPIPHTPWPLVHPLPSLVPQPTKSPAMILKEKLALVAFGISILRKICTRAVPHTNPIKNKIRQIFCLGRRIACHNVPLIPQFCLNRSLISGLKSRSISRPKRDI